MPYLNSGGGETIFAEQKPQYSAHNVHPPTPSNSSFSSSEERKTAQFEDNRHAFPFEMEEGQDLGQHPMQSRPSYSRPTSMTKPDERSMCEKHRGKLACVGVLVPLLLLLLILSAVFYPRRPRVSLFSTSILDVDGFTGATANFVIQIANPNYVGLTFSHVVAEVFDYSGIKIGTVSRPDRFQVPPRSTGMMGMVGVFKSNLPEIGLVGMHCLSNNYVTQVQIRASADLRVAGMTRRVQSLTNENVPCSVRNVAAGGFAPGGARGGTPFTNGAPGAAGAGGAPFVPRGAGAAGGGGGGVGGVGAAAPSSPPFIPQPAPRQPRPVAAGAAPFPPTPDAGTAGAAPAPPRPVAAGAVGSLEAPVGANNAVAAGGWGANVGAGGV